MLSCLSRQCGSYGVSSCCFLSGYVAEVATVFLFSCERSMGFRCHIFSILMPYPAELLPIEMSSSDVNASPPSEIDVSVDLAEEVAMEEVANNSPAAVIALPPVVVPSVSTAEKFLIEVVNTRPSDRVVTLLAMFTGLPFQVDVEHEEPFFKYDKRSELRLTK